MSSYDEYENRSGLVKKKQRRDLWVAVGIVFVVAYMLATTTLLAISALYSFTVRDQILDCTDPSGQCYREGQERTAVLVNQLIQDSHNRSVKTRQIIIAAATCQTQLGFSTEHKMQACIKQQLKEGK